MSPRSPLQFEAMRALYYQCFRNAETALIENMALADKTMPVAVALDIDETVLDNSPFQGWQVIGVHGPHPGSTGFRHSQYDAYGST